MKTVLKITLPILVAGAGIFAAAWLIKTKPQAARKPVPEKAALVAVERAEPKTHEVTVVAMGEVKPSRTLVVMPEVNGRIVEHHPALVPDGRIAAGETLVKIDDRDYKLSAAQQAAQVAQSKTSLRLEKGQKSIAEREWDLMSSQIKDASGKDLALREPQLEAAQATVRGARASLARARLAIEKTTITAPFNAIVQEESVEVGQMVSPTSRLATLIGSDTFWVEVSVPVDELRWLTIPRVNTAEEKGSKVKVIHEVGAVRTEHVGHVIRLKSSLDELGKMARLIVAIDNPLGLEADGTSDELPLFIGAYVRCEISGSAVDDVVKLPRVALRDKGQVWLKNDESRLALRNVEVRYSTAEYALVQGLEAGDKVVVSNLPQPIPRMKLKVEGEAPADGKKTAQAAGDDGEAKHADSEVGSK